MGFIEDKFQQVQEGLSEAVEWIEQAPVAAKNRMEEAITVARVAVGEAYEVAAGGIERAQESASLAIALTTEATTRAADGAVALAKETVNQSILKAQEATSEFLSGTSDNLDELTGRLQRYASEFSDDDFWGHIKKYAVAMGLEGMKAALVLYYTFTAPESEVPKRIKVLILAALGYLISPVDLIPDAIPVIGLTDDVAVLLLVLDVIAKYIPEVAYPKADAKIRELFGDGTTKELPR